MIRPAPRARRAGFIILTMENSGYHWKVFSNNGSRTRAHLMNVRTQAHCTDSNDGGRTSSVHPKFSVIGYKTTNILKVNGPFDRFFILPVSNVIKVLNYVSCFDLAFLRKK